MTSDTNHSDITVRGGLINVPTSKADPLAGRHQPNTPRNKKTTTTRADYQPAVPAIEQPPVKTKRKKKRSTDNVSTPTSESD